MQKLLFAVILLFTFQLSIFSQDEKTVEKIPNNVKITGTIENPVSEIITLQSRKVDGVNEVADVEDGKFVLEFVLDKPTYLNFGHGNEVGRIFLEPGDDVSLFINPEQFDETLKLSGKGCEESNYMLEKYLLDEGQGVEMKVLFAKPVDEFLKLVGEKNTRSLKHLEEFKNNTKNYNNDFAKDEAESIYYNNLSLKVNYPTYYKFFAKKKVENLPDDYFSFMDKVDINDEKLFEENPTYSRLVSSYLLGLGNGDRSEKHEIESVFDHAEQKLTSGSIKQQILFSILDEYISFYDVNGLENVVERFNKISTNEEAKEAINKNYAAAKKIMKGQPAPTFAYQDTEGNEVDLKSFRGKIVYIDVWATWCGPCIAEVPYLKELEKSFHGNDEIVFMSVSIDREKDKEKWEKMVEEKELGGIQLMADAAWQSSIVKDYNIRGIPRFLLIGKNGEIINSSAPRPSNDSIKEILSELVEPR